jgi:hypothetical protein
VYRILFPKCRVINKRTNKFCHHCVWNRIMRLLMLIKKQPQGSHQVNSKKIRLIKFEVGWLIGWTVNI